MPTPQSLLVALALFCVVVVVVYAYARRRRLLTKGATVPQASTIEQVADASHQVRADGTLTAPRVISPSSTMDNLAMNTPRHLLSGKVVVFIGAGSSPSKRSMYETAKEHGVISVVLDGSGSWAADMAADGTIKAFHPIDFDAEAEVTLARMHSAVEEIRTTVGEPTGVCTFFEIAVPLATRLAETLGLPCNPIEAVEAARDKHATRRISAAAGLPTPRHASIESAADLAGAAAAVGFPAVIKPIGMFQSMGVLRVDSTEELEVAYAKVLAELDAAHAAAGQAADYRTTAATLGTKMVLEEVTAAPVCSTAPPVHSVASEGLPCSLLPPSPPPPIKRHHRSHAT